MSAFYILDGRTPLPESDSFAWGLWYANTDRRVRKETVCGSEISTVFLGMDHSFGSGKPLLFETMVFDGPLDGEMERCSTWDEAEAMHERMVERVRAAGVLA